MTRTEDEFSRGDLLYVPKGTLNAAALNLIDSCVHNLIQIHFVDQPDSPAIHSWDGRYTYGELDELSAGVASHLRAQGIGPGDFVPLLFEKSKYTPVALLGVIRTGAAFVLLDASQPEDRLKGICHDVNAKILIASSEKTAMAAKLAPRAVTVNATHLAAWKINEHPDGEFIASVTPNSALYVVFTSGSTGRPKGVVMEHSAFCTSALTTGLAFGLNRKSRVLQFSSYAWDASITDHLVTLILGGCVCIPSDSQRKGDLSSLVDDLQCTWVGTTPSVARLLDPERVPSLQVLALGGEALSSELIRTWYPRFKVVQGYGPAECAVAVSVHSSMSDSTPPNNIGHVTCAIGWVVDPNDHNILLPLGEKGELIVQGPNVGRGYLGRAKEAKSSFLDPPEWLYRHGKISYGRLYKTGDIVQYSPDGSLRFFGRADNQVKIHGQRVELGEIESKLKQALREQSTTVVELIHRKNDLSPILVGFVYRETQNPVQQPSQHPRGLFLLPDAKSQTDARRAHASLSAVLPSYMIPSDLFFISHIPMTRTDKADRRKIRTYAESLSAEDRRIYGTLLSQTKNVPSSPEEQSLLYIWASILKLNPDQIGVEDNFFHLGGTSMSAMSLTSVSHKRGLPNFSPLLVFKHPTIRAMARELKKPGALNSSVGTSTSSSYHLKQSIVHNLACYGPLKGKDIMGDVVPVTEFQKECLQGRPLFLTLEIPPVNHGRLENAWNAVQQKHAVLRSVYLSYEGVTYQAFLRQLTTTIPISNCDGRPLVEFVAEFCKKTGLEQIPEGNLYWRIWRIDGPESSALVLRTHHAQFDPVAVGVLLNDFVAAYEGPLKPAQIDFPEYMSRRLQQNGSPQALEFWGSFYEGRKFPFSTTLASMTPPVGITPSMIMRAAWALVLSQRTESDDIVFGEVVHGRSFPAEGVSEVVGCTVGVCPMRIQISRVTTAKELLLQCKERYIERVPYETVDMKVIARQCTSWGQYQLSSIVMGEEFDVTPRITLDGRECPHKYHYPEGTEDEMKEVYLWLADEGEGLSLAMYIPRNLSMPQYAGESFIRTVVQIMEKLSASPDLPLSEIML
ncbi:hypothetical protein N7510_005800 [Penicillium lagena]|uniref:uncharacterized protein n=1 Tax=Penicillium lagena TaxID=94218 RepID=UPI002540843D|nr:uncharacterized protein N7510_005800 [Penicillium lagena]KAJ5612606.1 hypothetical protein N7510_005800 [Penicillium lagena]